MTCHTWRPASDVRVLSRVALFSGLDGTALAEVHRAGVRRRLEAGTQLFVEGGPATTLFVLLDGRARVTRSAAGGQIVTLHLANAGDVLGCAILGGARAYPGSAEVLTEATALAFDERAITGIVARHPIVARNALKMLSGRMEDLRVRVRDLSTECVERRIASAFVRLAEEAEEASLRPDLRLSRQDLAELVGATQYTVSRVVSGWQRAGWIEAGRQRFTIVDLPALRRVVATG